MKSIDRLGTIKYLLIAAVLILAGVYVITTNSIVPISSQNQYDFPLNKTSVEKALDEVALDWSITKQDSLDESNMNFFLSNTEDEKRLIISSMKKQGMLSLAITPINPIKYETDILDDEKRKQLIQLACEFTGIEKHDSIYREFNKYITDRDSWKYGDTAWYYKTKDRVLTIRLDRSSLYIGKYQIRGIQVYNIPFFKEQKKIWTNNYTQRYQKDGVTIYTDISLKALKRELSKKNQYISRIVIEGNVTTTREARVKELEELTLEDSKYSLYAEDYHFADISDDTDTIEVLLPSYIVDFSLHKNGEKEWHITYHPSSNIYIAEYGLDIQ